MNRQETVKYLIKDSDWLKKVWIRKLNISYNQLARWLGPNPVNIRVSNVEAVAKVCGYTVDWIDENQQELELIKLEPEPQDGPAENSRYNPHRSFTIETLPTIRYMPVLTIKQLKKLHGPEIGQSSMHTSHQIACPPEMGNQQAYAIAIQDETMSPALTPHMRVIVSTEERCVAGDLIIMGTADENWYIGKLRFNNDTVILTRYNADEIKIPRDQVMFKYKVIWIRLPL